MPRSGTGICRCERPPLRTETTERSRKQPLPDGVFEDQELFVLGSDNTPYRHIGDAGTALVHLGGDPYLRVSSTALSRVAETAFTDAAHYLRPGHLAQLAQIVNDRTTTVNERFVALEMIKNAVIAADGLYPLCQDTGTALVTGFKGHQVLTDGEDHRAISRGIHAAYTGHAFRYSQMAPLSLYDETNTRTNLPAQIDLLAAKGASYQFLCLAKGGGSANKTALYQQTRAILSPDRLVPFLVEKIRALGTAACPPYHLAVVIGGTSADACLKTVKWASAGFLDRLPVTGNSGGRAFRVPELEAALLAATQEFGIGAQFGGRYFCHDVRVIRLPRHAASCPIGIGVSCSAHRNILAKIDADGLFVEQLETDPAQYLPTPEPAPDVPPVHMDLNQPMDRLREQLSACPVGTLLLLNGPMVVARDMAHARIAEHLKTHGRLPAYLQDNIIYYAGPAKTPAGYAAGAFGPTTAGRMDPYLETFQKHGGSLVTLAKGNRSASVTRTCQTHGGFYLGSIGGPAARLGRDCIRRVSVIDHADLGMEAVFRIEVSQFPAFVLVDDKGNDFYQAVMGSC
ncbi:MAG: fumarate hydratase [Deltaproteobacteria bacterium]|nr:MAG: fumarate hydratase [Deltaproteobacteria bacterium]